MRRKIFTTLVATILSAVSLTAYATEDPVSYVYYTVDGTTATMHTDGSQTSYTVVTDQTTWNDGGWYVVNNDVTIADRITVSGTVNLILCDGKILTASKGITVASGDALNIYAQSAGTGALTASGDSNSAGIGGGESGSGGTVNIHGGAVTATGGSNAAGIGGRSNGAGGTVTIYAGTVNATGNIGAGIGGGYFGVGGSVTIYGGTVTATGGTFATYTGMGIGAGAFGSNNGSLTLGTGVTMEVSSDNSTWTDYSTDSDNRAQYMKASYTAPAPADPVSYVYYTVDGTTATMHTDGSQTSYTVVTDQTEWNDGGWYVVNSDVTIADRITVSGTVNLILCDGKTLTASKGITVNSENTLNIYAQSEGEGSGALIATGTEWDGDNAYAGIGGTMSNAGGTVIIHGGNVTAKGGMYGGGGAAGIGGGGGGAGGSVTIYAGTVTATGNNNGAGIGGGSRSSGGSVTIYAGTVTATGGEYGGAGIGGGFQGAGGSVAIHGGTVTATGGFDEMMSAGMGIGAGGNHRFLDPLDGGSLTLGTGVTMEVSSNNSTWTDYDGSTRARYMKSSVPIDPDQVAADSVVALIDSLPAEVAATDEAAIAAARAAYDALTDAQKAKVPAEKLTKLTDAEAALAAAKQAAADQAAADAVVALIDAIPADVTVAAEPAIVAARTAYDALTDAQKAKVPAEKLTKLTDAEAALAAAKTTTGIEDAAADAVESNIWYDLNGRRLNGKPTKSGIYINNHQKVYVK